MTVVRVTPAPDPPVQTKPEPVVLKVAAPPSDTHERRPITIPRSRSIDAVRLIESLTEMELLLLRRESYGYPESRIKQDLKAVPGWSSATTVASIRESAYQKLGVSHLETEREKFHAAGQILFKYVENTYQHEPIINPDLAKIVMPASPPVIQKPSACALPETPVDPDSAELQRLWKDLQSSGALDDEEELDELIRG
jgi:hypothetical protein